MRERESWEVNPAALEALLEAESSLLREFIAAGATVEDVEALTAEQRGLVAAIREVATPADYQEVLTAIRMHHQDIARRYLAFRQVVHPEQFDDQGRPIDPVA